MEQYDVIVIGGGPAGLFAAIASQGQGGNGLRKVLLLEKNPKPGRKLRLSGAGQCNFTHGGDIKDFLSHYGENGRFLKRALYNFSNQDLIKFFKARGLDFVENPEGKIFPITMKAEDVLEVLLKECDKKAIDILCNHRVERIVKDADIFHVYTAGREYRGKGDIIKLSFVSAKNEEEFNRQFISLFQDHGKSLVKNALKNIPIPERLMQKLMELSDISEKVQCAQLDRERRKKLAGLLYGFPLEVERLGDFNIAMVTRGGISLKEVNPNTMESRLVPGLFFVGEVLDIDGDTGGYNIQAAASTGWLAGNSISHKQTNNGNIM